MTMTEIVPAMRGQSPRETRASRSAVQTCCSAHRSVSAGTVNGTRLHGLSRLRDRLAVPNLIFASTSPSAHRRGGRYAGPGGANRAHRPAPDRALQLSLRAALETLHQGPGWL